MQTTLQSSCVGESPVVNCKGEYKCPIGNTHDAVNQGNAKTEGKKVKFAQSTSEISDMPEEILTLVTEQRFIVEGGKR